MPWRCARCRTVHTQNAGKCRSCEHTVFDTVRRRELEENSDGIDRPKAMKLKRENRVGTAPKRSELGLKGPDVNPDGSIKRNEHDIEGLRSEKDGGRGVLGRIRALMPF